MNFLDDKVTGNVGIPGTGLAYYQSLDSKGTSEEPGQGAAGHVSCSGSCWSPWFAYVLLR